MNYRYHTHIKKKKSEILAMISKKDMLHCWKAIVITHSCCLTEILQRFFFFKDKNWFPTLTTKYQRTERCPEPVPGLS